MEPCLSKLMMIGFISNVKVNNLWKLGLFLFQARILKLLLALYSYIRILTDCNY